MTLEALDSVTIVELARAMGEREVSARELAEAYLARTAALDERVNAVLEINPEALTIAGALDAERSARGPRGPLHGIPVMLKDNIDTGDTMTTSAGSLALDGTRANADSAVARALRAAGAVILGKTNLSEWANFRSTRSASGWSSRGGQTRNPYDPARTPGGSSSGSGVAVSAGFCAGAIGTETDGSIVVPASMNGIVGIKPTVGLVGRSGIIPISASQDTAGPMARTVADAAALLAALAGEDPDDPATVGASRRGERIAGGLDEGALRGARIGVARGYAGYHDRVDALFDAALEAMRHCGATIVDPVSLRLAETVWPAERLVMMTEFKHGLEAYLGTRPAGSVIASLAGIIAFNAANAATVMPHFAQEILERAATTDGLDDPAYVAARETSLRLASAEGIDATLGAHALDAIVAPTTTPAWMIDWIDGDNGRGGCSCLPAVAGYPHVTVPMGFVEHLPVGLSVFASAHADRAVIDIAHAFERCTRHRRAPAL